MASVSSLLLTSAFESTLAIHGETVAVLSGADAGKSFIGVILVEPAVMLGDLVEDPREKVTATFARTSCPALSPRDTIRDESGNLWSAVKRTNNPADNTVEFELLIITAKDK